MLTDATQENLDIAQRYAALPADKRARFKARLREHGIDGSALPIVPLAERPARAPLSHAQERLWFMWRLDPASSAYNIARALRIDGPLDVAALDAALAALVERHEALRTAFGEAGGVPFQHVRPVGDGPRARHLDLREPASPGVHDAPDASGEALGAHLRAAAAAPFDLEHDPLLRFDVLRIGAQAYVVQMVIHHIVSDAWSMGLLIREFVSLYGAARRDGVPPAAPAALQYRDVASWEREWVDADALARHLSYWSAQLAGPAPVLALPADRPRPAARDGRGARVAIDLDPALAAALARVARRHDATRFMTLLHAFNLLLHRYSGETDIWVGVPVAGRERAETHAVMGFFVNTLVIRSRIAPAQPLDRQLQTLRDTVLDAHAHAGLPFAQLLDTLRTGRDLAHAPLFQVMFNVDYADPAARVELPGLRATPVDGDAGAVRFDLTLNIVESADCLRAVFSYACDMFDAATVERLARDYRAVLEQLAARPERLPGDLVLSGAALPSQALRRYAFEPVTPRIVARAASCPDATALYCGDARLSYRELDAWSNRIARALKRAGVGPDTRVGVCMTRSIALPAALLAVWKAGGAYVPLDPDYPHERLRDMLDDAQIRAVVIDRPCGAQLGGLLAGRTQVDVGDVAHEDATGWDEPVHPRQLAYVLYTSGSTGRPKGVALDHEALALHLRDFRDAYRIGADDVMLQSSTINFDVALHELLPALLAGGAVRMRGPHAWTLDTLNATLAAGVTFARIPTALWQQWQRHAPPATDLPALRQITVGGEALPRDELARWHDGPLRHIALDNLYGPTETAIAALRHATAPADAERAVVPIGRPFPGRGAVVLDPDGNRMPHGGAGELCITGACVARGYLGRAALTAERFVPDPDGPPGARLYRSGDLCRVGDDGAVLFLGRLDQQVKLRGQRIELGEIEAALRTDPNVSEAAVVLHADGAQQRLVAYVVAAPGTAVDALREALAVRLPAFMVPADFMLLDRLPVMANGKLDRRALPAPASASGSAAARVAPRNAREQTLLTIWEQVLGCEIGDVHANFFAAGGDSILSLQLLSRARDAGLLLTPKQVFEHPSIAQMAQVARALDAAAAVPAAAERHDAQPLTPIQATFFDKHPDGLAHWNQSVLLEVRDALDPAVLEATLHRLVARHDALRLRFERAADASPQAPASRYWRQRVAPDEPATLLRHVRLEPDAWETGLAAAGTALHRSLDLRHGPLLRAAYVDAGVARRLLIVVHHLAVDGVSWRILLDELQALHVRPDDTLPPVTTPWSEWVSRQPHHARQAERLWELAWWQRMLHGASAALPLEGDGDRRLSASRVVTVTLPAQATHALLRRGARPNDARPEELLLAALAETLGPWADASRLLIDLEGHGREDLIDGVDLSRTVGWFTTQYPLALPHHGNAARTLSSVRDLLRAVPDKGFSWGALLRFGDDASRAALAALPAPSLRFNYLGRFDQTLPADGRFRFAREPVGPQADDRDAMDHVLDIGALVASDRLTVHWRYSPGVLSEATVTRLSNRFEAVLVDLIECDAAEPASDVRGDAPAPADTVPDAFPASQTGAESDDDADRAVFALWRQRVRLEIAASALACCRFAPRISAPGPAHRFGPLPAGIVPLNDLRAPHAVFCIHAGHGLVAEYRSLARALNGRATLFGLQAPGLGDPHWRAADFDSLAADYVARIRNVQPDGPYRLLGWSFGARVLVSMVEQLERAAQPVALAGLIDALPDRDADDDVQAEVRALRAWVARHAALGMRASERALFEAACDVILEHGRVVDTFRMPALHTPLALWWSTESVESGKPRDWAARAGTTETVLAEIPAGHTSIMHHPMLLDSVRGLFA
ncbi:amino acid adenylation domain-containing protein [Burkholderia cenocepacia]|uniref:non-ribosomal peptide synthetase n=1 Tax=Burkholderia cenocepacia TaxID=95486 RepID=UPI000F5C22B7|nr:non-ribosomal peptide synthetase [Burkholderia cenocepacia]RQV08992.1 amino acid adenylation domain-containing protein [Burkholderia cenocepacia]